MLKDKKKSKRKNSNSWGIVVEGLIHLLRGRNSPDLTGNYSSSPATQSQDLTLVDLQVSGIVDNIHWFVLGEPYELLKFPKFLTYWNMN